MDRATSARPQFAAAAASVTTVPFIKGKLPMTVWYSEQPPALGGVAEQIPIAEFMRRYVAHGGKPFEYTETIWLQPHLNAELPLANDPQKKYKEHHKLLDKFLQKPQQFIDKFIISFINPDVGFGVFAREKFSQNEIVAVYSGVYGFDISEYSFVIAAALGDRSIDAKSKGGIARFFQHMPISLYEWYQEYQRLKTTPGAKQIFSSEIMDQALKLPFLSPDDFSLLHKKLYPSTPCLSYKPEGDGDVALNNVLKEIYIMNGIPVVFFYSSRPIEVNEQIGCGYGRGYFEMRGQMPSLFNKKGLAIGPHPELYYK